MKQVDFKDSGMRRNSPERVLEGPIRLLCALQKPDIAQQGSLIPRINRQYLQGHDAGRVSCLLLPMPSATPNRNEI